MGVEIADDWTGGAYGPTTDDTGTAEYGATWQPVDLTETMAGLVAGTLTRHAPSIGRRDDGAALFYPGKVNGIAGASGCGKSWTALHTAGQEVTAGHPVVYVDLEDDSAGVAGRLFDIGTDPQTVLQRFHYVSPDEPYGLAAKSDLEARVAALRPSLVVVDSTGESMALDGAKPNDDDDVARWFRRLPTALARLGPAVVVLDHVVKTDDGGLWPIGSQRKRAAITGAQYMQSILRPFAKDTAGVAKLVCAKDRHGNYRPGQKVAELAVTPDAGRLHIELRNATDTSHTGGDMFRPTALMEKVSRAVELAGDDGLSVRGIEDRATGKKRAISQATDVLVVEGYVVRTHGPRRALIHTSARPYRQADDPLSDVYDGGGQSPSPSVPNECVTVPVPKDGGQRDSQTTVPRGQSGDSGGTVGSQPSRASRATTGGDVAQLPVDYPKVGRCLDCDGLLTRRPPPTCACPFEHDDDAALGALA